MSEKKVGEVFQFFSRPSVAAIRITEGCLKVGDKIHILGNTTDLRQTVESMQVSHMRVHVANAGDEIGMMVFERVRRNDAVYVVTD